MKSADKYEELWAAREDHLKQSLSMPVYAILRIEWSENV